MAHWTVAATEARLSGLFNVTGPAETLSLDQFIQACLKASVADARLAWVSEAFLQDNDVKPFTEMLLWVQDEHAGSMLVNIDKASRDGLAFRPLCDNVRDTLLWSQQRPGSYEWRNAKQAERSRSATKMA